MLVRSTLHTPEVVAVSGQARATRRGVTVAGGGLAALAAATWLGAVTQHADRPLLAAGIGLLAVASFSLLRRFPAATFVTALLAPGLAEAAAGFDGHDDPFLLLVVLSSFGLGRYGSARQQPLVGAGVLGLLALNVAAPGEFSAPAQLVFPVLLTGAPWALGVLVRLALERERLANDLAAQLREVHRVELHEAALSERLRLAHDLHDVAGHTLSVVAIQAQVLRRRLERGDTLDGADVAQLERQASQAMDELRSVVKVLRPSAPGAQRSDPRVEQLPRLIEDCRAAGQQIVWSLLLRKFSAGARATLSKRATRRISPQVDMTSFVGMRSSLSAEASRATGSDVPTARAGCPAQAGRTAEVPRGNRERPWRA